MRFALLGTSKNLAPAAATLRVDPLGAWISLLHTSLSLSRRLRSSILSSRRLVWIKDIHACHPFEVLRGTLLVLAALFMDLAPAAAQDKASAPAATSAQKSSGLDELTDQLDLTAEQDQKVDAINAEFARKAKDQKALGLPKEEQRPKMKALKDERDAALKKVLTKEQWTRLEALREERKAAKKAGDDEKEDKERAPHQE